MDRPAGFGSTPDSDIWNGRVRADATPTPSLSDDRLDDLVAGAACHRLCWSRPLKSLTAAPGFGTIADQLKSTLREFTRDIKRPAADRAPQSLLRQRRTGNLHPQIPLALLLQQAVCHSTYELALRASGLARGAAAVALRGRHAMAPRLRSATCRASSRMLRPRRP